MRVLPAARWLAVVPLAEPLEPSRIPLSSLVGLSKFARLNALKNETMGSMVSPSRTLIGQLSFKSRARSQLIPTCPPPSVAGQAGSVLGIGGAGHKGCWTAPSAASCD